MLYLRNTPFTCTWLTESQRLHEGCRCCCMPTDLLPTPTLVLQRQKEVWRLLCTGSPSYPGAVFSLYLGADELPIATHSAAIIHHQVTFPIPVQDAPVGLYQCQYSVLLGKKWSHSERSPPLLLTKGALCKCESWVMAAKRSGLTRLVLI